jgi:hypothetical protein
LVFGIFWFRFFFQLWNSWKKSEPGHCVMLRCRICQWRHVAFFSWKSRFEVTKF